MRSQRASAFAVASAISVGVIAACGSSSSDSGGTSRVDGAGDGGAPDATTTTTTPSQDGATTTPAADAQTGDDAADNDAADAGAAFGLDSRPVNTTCKPFARPPSASPIKFAPVFANVTLAAPMMMAQIPGDSSRWFVAQRGNDTSATIVTFASSNPSNAPVVVATIGPQALANPADGNDTAGAEGGLLGIAFHPQFATNGRLYITRVTPGLTAGSLPRSEVGYFTSTNNGTSFGSYQAIFDFTQSAAPAHKGGGIAFGKDGYLYLSFGDGGPPDDNYDHGQETSSYFAKILRIDVDHPANGKLYGIPASNPFASGVGGLPEIFAYGFRNPFRFSIDSATNQLWVGDVGQNHWEEIDKVAVGTNNGWPCKEATHLYLNTDPAKCPSVAGLTDPVAELSHATAADPNAINTRAIVGGFVYHGKAIPSLQGTYVFGDYIRQELYTLTFDPTTDAPVITTISGAPAESWVSFAQDQDGELYTASIDHGHVYKLVANSTADAGAGAGDGGSGSELPPPALLSQSGCVLPASPSTPATGLIPYDVNSPLWSDGAQKGRYFALPEGRTIHVDDAGHFNFPIGAVLMKNFDVGGKHIETRFLVHHDDGGWAGYTYAWRDDQSDADLLLSSESKSLPSQTWYYPSRDECVHCHNETAKVSLGLELGQLNGDFTYPGSAGTARTANQLATLDHIGVLDAPLPAAPSQIVAYPSPSGTAPVDERARSYLHANCAYCHQPGGPGAGVADWRFSNTFAQTAACNANPVEGNLGITGAKLVVPGNPSLSLISYRMHQRSANRMPPLATSVVDTTGTAAVDAWITSLTTCP